MYGIPGVDHIAHPGLLKKVIAGSFPSGPSNMPSPKIWQMIIDNQIQAYNVPSGILFHMHRESAAGGPGVLTKVGMDTFVDPRRQGARMNKCTLRKLFGSLTLKATNGCFSLRYRRILRSSEPRPPMNVATSHLSTKALT